jgi:hypothetical protein
VGGARGWEVADVSIEQVQYNCICDEYVSLHCSNRTCRREIAPDSMMVIASDGSVFCSETCAGAESNE